MKKALIILMTLMAFTAALIAQDMKAGGGVMPRSFYTFSWNTTFTLGDFNKWVSSPSPAGFNFGGKYFIEEGFHAGFDIGWQRISQAYGYQTYYGENGIAITATNYRFTWMVPFQLTAGYMFMRNKIISPYVSFGIGGDYMEHHLAIQEYDFYETRWDFSLTPEVGTLVKFGYYSSMAAIVAVNYKWTSNKIELLKTVETKYLQMMGLRIGICYIID